MDVVKEANRQTTIAKLKRLEDLWDDGQTQFYQGKDFINNLIHC